MALTLRFNLNENENGTLVAIQDTTGNYNGSSNPNGYGTLNPDWTAAEAVLVRFESMDEDSIFSEVYLVDIFSSINLVDYFSLQTPYSMSVSLPDGWYRITYTVTISGIDHVSTTYMAFYSNIRCCFKNKALKAAQCKCNCEPLKCELMELATYIEAIQAGEESENGLAVLDGIEAALKLCSNCGCC